MTADVNIDNEFTVNTSSWMQDSLSIFSIIVILASYIDSVLLDEVESEVDAVCPNSEGEEECDKEQQVASHEELETKSTTSKGKGSCRLKKKPVNQEPTSKSSFTGKQVPILKLSEIPITDHIVHACKSA